MGAVEEVEQVASYRGFKVERGVFFWGQPFWRWSCPKCTVCGGPYMCIDAMLEGVDGHLIECAAQRPGLSIQEKTKHKAERLRLRQSTDLERIRKIDQKLRGLLKSDDTFWIRWSYFVELRLGEDYIKELEQGLVAGDKGKRESTDED